MDHASITHLLADYPCFSALEPEQVEAIAGQAVRHLFEPEQIIFLEGDPSAGLWFIEQGTVKIYKLNPEGVEHILHLLGVGDTFNDIAALDGSPNPANAAALSISTCWVVPYDVMRGALERYPRMALAAIHLLTGRVRQLAGQIEDLALYSVTARLARFLLSQAEDPALRGPGVTRAAIAAHLATTPETISRVLARLQEAGAIRFDRHRILITDADILRSIAML
ncbi:MAG: Crp/Fnr family transcriptional regulator [Anaerolineae bacterium]